MEYLASILAIIGYRLRGSAGKGGWIDKLTGYAPGTRFGRMLWCAPIAGVVAQSWIEILPVMLAAYVGVMFGYWGGEFNLEHKPNRNFKNYAILTVRGMVIPLFVCLITLDYWWAIAGGALFVPCYLAGLWIAPRLKLPLLHGFSEWGELLLGASIVIGFSL